MVLRVSVDVRCAVGDICRRQDWTHFLDVVVSSTGPAGSVSVSWGPGRPIWGAESLAIIHCAYVVADVLLVVVSSFIATDLRGSYRRSPGLEERAGALLGGAWRCLSTRGGWRCALLLLRC